MLLSGGLDSAAALFDPDVKPALALFVDYGQVSREGEEGAAAKAARAAGVPLEIVRVPGLAEIGAGTLTGAAQAVSADGLSAAQREEWFPARNLLLAAIGAARLAKAGGGELWFGARAPAYKDGTPLFFAALDVALARALPDDARVHPRFPERSRAEVLSAAVGAGLDPRTTFSCNRRGDRHCWRCASCADRLKLLEQTW